MKGKNIFEAGKTAYECKKCKTRMMFNEKQSIKCPFCKSTDLKQLSQKEWNEGYKKEIHVIIGVYSGVIDEVNVFRSDRDATEHEKALCEQYGIPFDQEKREQYYESDGEHEVKHIITEVQ